MAPKTWRLLEIKIWNEKFAMSRLLFSYQLLRIGKSVQVFRCTFYGLVDWFHRISHLKVLFFWIFLTISGHKTSSYCIVSKLSISHVFCANCNSLPLFGSQMGAFSTEMRISSSPVYRCLVFWTLILQLREQSPHWPWNQRRFLEWKTWLINQSTQ